MKNYLATTGLFEHWSLDNPLILLGPWCITEPSRKILNDKSFTVAPSPFNPAIKIKEAADYCDEVYHRLITQLTIQLNAVHRTNFPEKYWKILVGPWLYFFIGVFYERYKRIENAISLYEEFFLHALPKERLSLTCFDSYDFINNKVNDHFYNFNLFSLIAHECCPSKIVEISLNLKLKSTYRKFSLRSRWQWWFHNKLFSRGEILLSEMVFLSLLEKLKIKFHPRLKNIGFYEFAINDRMQMYNSKEIVHRKNLFFTEDRNSFEKLFFRLLPDALPIRYIELYKENAGCVEKIKSLKNKKLIGSTYGWYFNEPFKFFAAKSAIEGAKIIEFQHGGGYGTFLTNPNEKLALQKDYLFTFGWKSIDHPEKTYPLPNYYISKIRNTYNQKLKKVILVGTDRSLYHYKFVTHTNPEDMAKYLDDKKKLYDSLLPSIKGNFLYRPRFNKPVWETEETIKKLMPNIEIIRHKPLIEWMKKVALVIIDHPHAAILEALVINVPCIFYWDHRVYLMNANAEPYFQLLRDAGILHTNPESAAAQVNAVWDDSNGWWLQSQCQSTRTEFVNHFCLSDNLWKNQWSIAFKKILKSG